MEPADVSIEEYAGLDDAGRAALDLTQSRRKRLEKLLAARRKKAAKAGASAAAGAGAGGGGEAAAATRGGRDRQPRAKGRPARRPEGDERTRPLETPPGEKKRLSEEMAASYHPGDVEAAWYEWWDKAGFFKVSAAEATARGLAAEDRFVMVIPPPNVTGSLHLGHALMCAIQDAVCRWHRMHGRTALYVPGVDHAGIATQVVVEKQLARAGRPGRREMGRDAFVAEVWKWKEEYGGRICEQMRRIGSGLDWDREEFTMSDKLNAAVNEAFVRFYDAGLIYRDTRLVNWSCALKTAISDIEVDTVELDGPTMLDVPGEEAPVEFGAITSFAYRLAPEEGAPDGELVVATTRLETMLGDVAVAVHPDDARYKHLIGRKLVHPFVPDRELVVVGDRDLVNMEFGTGAVKVTPAHDPNDFACGRRHGLPEVTMLNDDGTIHARCGAQFAGARRYAARAAIERALDALGLYRGKAANPMALGLCSRSGDVVEPLLKPQWWVDCTDLAKRSADAVRRGDLKLVPRTAEATWYAWLDNIRDWCVSRQLWWGHRIPAYRATVGGGGGGGDGGGGGGGGGGDGRWVVGRSEAEARERAAALLGADPASVVLEQDDDVLDTWFSSGLFPFSVFGWPDETPDMAAFFPTSLLETGYDILFFWVARMVMMSLGLTGKLPFHTVCLHSMVRDKRGRKMSKSVGNVIDPLCIIDGTSLETLVETVVNSNLSAEEVRRAVADKEAEFPNGIPPCGADSLRMGLLAYMTSAGDINLDVANVVIYRNFGNKLWNATKFAISNLGGDFRPSADGLAAAVQLGHVADRWILSRLNGAAQRADAAFKEFKFGDLATAVHRFWIEDLCAVYLENMKPVMRGGDEAAKAAARQVLYEALFAGLRLLHPMMPFVTEELYQRLPGPKPYDSIVVAAYPVYDAARCDDAAEAAMAAMKAVTQAIRSVAKGCGLKPQDRPDAYVLASDAAAAAAIDPAYVQALAGCGSLNVLTAGGGAAPPAGCAVKVVDGSYAVHLDASGLVDIASELGKLEAQAGNKRLAIEEIVKKEGAEGYETRVPQQVRRRNAENKAKREAELAQIAGLAEKFRRMLRPE
jgi:valyl-tRNA synthetase